MNEPLRRIAAEFQMEDDARECVAYGYGHINDTYLVTCAGGRRYILQRINDRVFPHVDELMENIASVTQFLRTKTEDPRRVLTLVPTTTGASYLQSGEGAYWRMYDFIEGSLCLQSPESGADFYQSALAFGDFQQRLSDYPAEALHETIANFHNTVNRYKIFHETLERDPCGRARTVAREIEFALVREREAGCLMDGLRAGRLPLRVTHNDTKLNNVLLDAKTRTPLCVIDLDTVMPGSSLYDFGDSIRFGAATAAEDETDLDKVEMDLSLFETFTRGFLTACPGLTPEEKRLLPTGAMLMTLECGLRFLTDYIDGDHYFAVHREGHNLDRCRTQFKLVADMERKASRMEELVWTLDGHNLKG